ncbi:MAG: hypothetical protein HY275_04950 [Gemmatimonadetes bacterium]|nr:hypothetical protein [Gemmatimonadota bacterium]
MPSRSDRRAFLGALATVTASASIAGALPAHAAPPADSRDARRARDARPSRAAAPWDDAWLGRITGAHKQVFDCTGVADGGPLGGVKNWWNAHKDAYGLASPNATAVVVLRGFASVIALDDAVWAKYPIGATTRTRDPLRKKGFATRNTFKTENPDAGPHEKGSSVMALMERGTIFCVCNNAISGGAEFLASQVKGAKADEVKAFMIANLIPGITLVPAGVQAVGLAQERGAGYCYQAG